MENTEWFCEKSMLIYEKTLKIQVKKFPATSSESLYCRVKLQCPSINSVEILSQHKSSACVESAKTSSICLFLLLHSPQVVILNSLPSKLCPSFQGVGGGQQGRNIYSFVFISCQFGNIENHIISGIDVLLLLPIFWPKNVVFLEIASFLCANTLVNLYYILDSSPSSSEPILYCGNEYSWRILKRYIALSICYQFLILFLFQTRATEKRAAYLGLFAGVHTPNSVWHYAISLF